jgi:PTS system nitrogen regulatory IIA component
MNLIAELLPPKNILVGSDVSSKKRVFEQAAQLFSENQQLDSSNIFDSLFAREKLGSTGLGHGVAIPHGRIKGLKTATGAIIQLASPIPFDAPDGLPVSLVFVLLVPEQATDLHLQILGELAEMFSDKEFRDQLLAANSGEQIHKMIAGWSSNDSDHRSAAV